MKPAAGILLMIWALLMVQPAFAYFGGKSAYEKCSKPVTEKPACSKKKPVETGCASSKCNKPFKPEGKDNCKSDGCNPTLGCSSGNFYVHDHHHITLPSWFEQRQKTALINDNRISKNMNECWHPPEIIS